jgi:hypothetical protein
MLTAIRQWVIRTMLKSKGQTGVVQTLPKKDLVELNVQITAQRLMQGGIEPNSLKNADQVENAVNAIESRSAVQQGIKSTPEAKVFDLEGKQIKNTDNIMGGEELPPPGSRGGDDDIAAPFASQEETMTNMVKDELMKTDSPFSDLVKTTEKGPKTLKEREAEVLASMKKNNKDAVKRIKNRKLISEAIDNASPGFVKGDRKYNAQLVAEDLAEKRFNKDFYDLDQKQQTDIYGEALDGLDDSDKFAQGGRAGYFLGGSSKAGKAFLEFMKKFKVKQSGDDLKDFLSKRKFLKDMVGNTEKNERARELTMLQENLDKYRKRYKGYEFPSDEQIKTDLEKIIQPILNKDRKLNATGGRAGYFKGGSSGKGIMEFFKNMIKPRGKVKFDETRFREGPIDLKFLENIDKKDLEPFIRSRDTMGRGGYGMYDNFADMPAGLRAAELIKTIKGPRNEINYKAAELFLGKKLRGDETVDELLQVLNRQEMRAEGGRIGLKTGMTKRAFLKLMGGTGAAIGAAKSGIFSGLGKGAGKQVAKEVVKKSTSTPPPYFFELAEKIKTLGRVTDGPQERLKIHTMPAKDGKSELMLTEDIGTGEMQIKKISKEGDDMVTEVQTMDYTPGSSQADEATQGIPADSYDEYTEFNSRIIKDEYNDPDIIDGIKVDEIIEEVKDQAPSIKKAGGGIARMLGE